ncbi:Variant-specific surface protein [Giardia duodenalis]|uniref:Variant-specific surface protein n=1 Tax=Giardia intestinalis TaxID=5741 RepID=V6TXA4_GIAIN|nr:Variant-specific surface protein [Giardia intestinalis]
MDGCYDARAAPGRGVCGEARDGACVMYKEEVRAETKEQLGAGTCEEVTGNEPNTCKTCGAVIGGTKYCSACNGDGSTSAPVDGTCQTENNECPNKANGRCTTCAQQSFMFKGGCYRIGQDPGQVMCKTAQDGVCTVVADGSKYFLPPAGEADNLHQSVIPCGDDSVVIVKDNKQYKGVANCLTCTAPTSGEANIPKAATCTACEDGYFVESAACTKCDESCLTCEGAGADKCKSCKEGYFLGATNDAAGKCIQCNNLDDPSWKGVQNCAKCTSSNTQNTPATCTECTENYYLKTVESTSSCETNCGEGFFATTVGSVKKCVQCSDTNNGGIADCSACVPIESPTTTVLVTCSACSQGKVSPGGSSCVPNCPDNSTDNKGACICNNGFAPSDDSCGASSSSNLSTGAMAGISVITLAACPVLLIVYLSL